MIRHDIIIVIPYIVISCVNIRDSTNALAKITDKPEKQKKSLPSSEWLRTTVRGGIITRRVQVDVAIPKEVISYRDCNGREPYTEWLNGLRDSQGRKRILARVRRLKKGTCGDCKRVREGVSELRIDCGPGYRVYFGEHGNTIVILLGGHKNSQDDDIRRALGYWNDYKNRERL